MQPIGTLLQGLSAGEQMADLERRQNAVRRFFDEQVAKLDIQETTRTELGTIVDWLPRPKDLMSPPPVPTRELKEGEEWATTELEEQAWARGPEGTLPQMRFDVEAYLESVGDQVPADPAEVLSSIPAPSAEGDGRYHNRWRVTMGRGPMDWLHYGMSQFDR